jgi:hypothetical protein
VWRPLLTGARALRGAAARVAASHIARVYATATLLRAAAAVAAMTATTPEAEEPFVMCNFNRAFKLEPVIMRTWCVRLGAAHCSRWQSARSLHLRVASAVDRSECHSVLRSAAKRVVLSALRIAPAGAIGAIGRLDVLARSPNALLWLFLWDNATQVADPSARARTHTPHAHTHARALTQVQRNIVGFAEAERGSNVAQRIHFTQLLPSQHQVRATPCQGRLRRRRLPRAAGSVPAGSLVLLLPL